MSRRNRITAILRAKRAVTAETAIRLGPYLGTRPELWMNLETAYDISVVKEEGSVIGRAYQLLPND